MRLRNPICSRKIDPHSSVMFKVDNISKYKIKQKLHFKGFYRIVLKIGKLKKYDVIFCSRPYFCEKGDINGQNK